MRQRITYAGEASSLSPDALLGAMRFDG